ncbi:S1C family serine protease [Polystyrenella longa]|uniref:S1C family serine protease n=1 Tax=Polystyrenella longa TaxID=2528007 RepID=UPI0011A5C178|nr:trypsin-like peptidase domain-containing protein [Polystyrenella longa]
MNNWLVAILLILVAALVLRFTNGGRDLFRNPTVEPRAVTARGDLAADETSTIELFQEASPSVVFITTKTSRLSLKNYNIYREDVPKGSGSGFIWDQDGHIVTNYHVLQGASSAEITLQDQQEYPAQLVGVAPEYDLAVLKIDAPSEKLKPLAIGVSDDLLVGQKAFAIGFPFGLDYTLTTGVISGLNREFRAAARDSSIKQAIQTDAAINPGNSGGPLLDSAGRLIGVNSAIYSDTGNSAGIGFAIPVNTVNEVVPDLIEDGVLSTPDLGIHPIAETWTITLVREGFLPRRGILFDRVFEGMGAAEVGLQPTRTTQTELILGDLIISVAGTDVKNNAELREVMKLHDVGDIVELIYLRNGEEQKTEIELKQAR